MSDDVDLAQRHEEFRRDRALGAVLADARVQAVGRSPLGCIGCGDLLDAERLKAAPGAQRCLECQEALERRRRLFPGGGC